MARPKLGDSDSKRLQMVISEDELRSIENWQFANRVPSKSEAIRRLCQIGLHYEAQADAAKEAVYQSYNVLMNLPQAMVGVGSTEIKNPTSEELANLLLSRLPEIIMAHFDAVQSTSNLASEIHAIKGTNDPKDMAKAAIDARTVAEDFSAKAREVHKRWTEENIK